MRPRTTFPDERLAIERQLSLIESRERALVKSVASGQATPIIYKELQQEDAAKTRLTARLADLDQLVRVTSLDAKRIERALQARVADVKHLLGRHVSPTRQMLRKLIDGHIVCTPFADARGRGYELTATGTYAGLFKIPAVNDGGGEGGI